MLAHQPHRLAPIREGHPGRRRAGGRAGPDGLVAYTAGNRSLVDADLVVWDPAGTKTLSVKTQFSKGDFNIFEGRTVKGIPSHTVSQGRVVFANGDLRAEQGKGRYIKRPAFSDNFSASRLRAETLAPTAVKR